eukprot:4277026-Pleurochrysis_carterae.AAC.1
MRAESGLLECPLMIAASALVLSIQCTTFLPRSSRANVRYAATAARSSSCPIYCLLLTKRSSTDP